MGTHKPCTCIWSPHTVIPWMYTRWGHTSLVLVYGHHIQLYLGCILDGDTHALYLYMVTTYSCTLDVSSMGTHKPCTCIWSPHTVIPWMYTRWGHTRLVLVYGNHIQLYLGCILDGDTQALYLYMVTTYSYTLDVYSMGTHNLVLVYCHHIRLYLGCILDGDTQALYLYMVTTYSYTLDVYLMGTHKPFTCIWSPHTVIPWMYPRWGHTRLVLVYGNHIQLYLGCILDGDTQALYLYMVTTYSYTLDVSSMGTHKPCTCIWSPHTVIHWMYT